MVYCFPGQNTLPQSLGTEPYNLQRNVFKGPQYTAVLKKKINKTSPKPKQPKNPQNQTWN